MDLKVGDSVDVPGGMYGTLKFVGQVQGKKGTFAGVDLSQQFWARGKNNGSVDGKSYFRSSKPTSGIFLPVDKAVRKTGPPTPSTPSLASFNVGGRTPSNGKASFSQSLGPGARAQSPAVKPALRRPSLPRPSSPLRQQPGAASTPTSRPSAVGLNKSKLGVGPRFTPSAKGTNFTSSLRNGAGTPSRQPLGYEPSFDEETDMDTTPTPTPIGVAQTTNDVVQQEEVKRLKAQLEDRNRQLRDQSATLSDMEKSLTELSTMIPSEDQQPQHSRSGSNESADVTQMRALLREKNEKIALLTQEFDAHRADFRSTLDALETASTETERVYEKRVDELLQQLSDLQDRGEDVQSVAMQLKQLEELVQELEEGLEDARRGEAEARGEVEHLRGEVERGRTELKHEKEKAAHLTRSGSGDTSRNPDYVSVKDMEGKEDEIRGLKAIIHSLSRDSMLSPGGTVLRSAGSPNGNVADDTDHVVELEKQVKELETVIERKAYREEELEREVERLRTSISLERPPSQVLPSNHNRLSDRTVVPVDWRDQSGPRHQLETMQEDTVSEVSKASTLRCELCEEQGHDVLNCTNIFGNNKPVTKSHRIGQESAFEGPTGLTVPSRTRDEDDNGAVAPLSPRRSPATTPRPPAGFTSGDRGPVKPVAAATEEKWCAVCDSEEHNTMECPYEGSI